MSDRQTQPEAETSPETVKLSAVKPRYTMSRAALIQKRTSAMQTGARSEHIETDRQVQLRFFGIQKAAWNRRAQRYVADVPHLRTGKSVKPRYRDAVLRLLVLREIFARIANKLSEVGVVTDAGEPRRLVDTARLFNAEIMKLETALGVLPASREEPVPTWESLTGGRS
jgi:hypothetical protein